MDIFGPPPEAHSKRWPKLTERQETFVYLVAQARMSRAKAYREAGYTQDANSSRSGACTLLANPNVKAALAEAREEFLKGIEMGKDEYVGYLVEVMRTPISEVDEDSPFCQEKTVTTVSTGDGPEILKTTIKMYSKQHAATQLGKVMGWEKPQSVIVGIDEKVSGLISLIRNRNRTVTPSNA